MQPHGFVLENPRPFVVPRGYYMEFFIQAHAIDFLRHRLRLRENGRGTALRYPTVESHRWECPSCVFKVQLLSSPGYFRVRFHRGHHLMSHMPGCPRAVDAADERFVRGAGPLAHALWPLPERQHEWTYGVYRRGKGTDVRLYPWDGAVI